MPSIAATSPTGEERVAQTGSAVTRPTASASGTVTAPTRSGQPAAAQASSHDRIAVSAGTSLMKGLLSGAAGLDGSCTGGQTYLYIVTVTVDPASRPVAASGITT